MDWLCRITAGLAAALLFALGIPSPVRAQEMDGMHTMQIIPIVVDSATFRSRITLFNPFGNELHFDATYVPGDGTSQAANGPLACGTVVVPGAVSVGFASIREICPGLPAGSQFGYLKLVRGNDHGAAQPFHQNAIHAYSRVNNYAGQGFSVEAFPMHSFGPVRQVVSGLRRMAATLTSPAFQTNCFVGTMDEAAQFRLELATQQGAALGTPLDFSLGPNRLVRLLDVFAASALPTGDYDNVKLTLSRTGGAASAFFGFCTVQDNTSYGADFRIAKQVYATDRNETHTVTALTDPLGRPFTLPSSSQAAYQLLAMDFRQPDGVRCTVSGTGSPAQPISGVNMKLLVKDPTNHTLRPVDDTGGYYYVSELMGPKSLINEGVNTTLFVHVFRTEGGAETPYQLQCLSGNGLSRPVIVDAGTGTLNLPFLP
jgi:hypothetical protein